MKANQPTSIVTICLVGLFLALLTVLPTVATASAVQDPVAPTPAPLPQFPQPAAPQSEWVYGVTAQGNYAYIGHNDWLEIVNISNPAAPTYVGRTVDIGTPYDIAVSGNYAYVASGDGYLKVINVSNPAAPTVVGSYTARGSAEGLVLSGSYVYMVDNAGLLIINVSNPAAPTLTGSYYNGPNASATSIALAGNYAYVVHVLGSALQIFNVSNPAAPTLTGQLNTGGWASDVAVAGSYAHVMTWAPFAVEIINVANPALPTKVSSYPYAGSKGVRVIGNYSYVAAGDSFRVLNVVNPTSPSLVGTYSPLAGTWDMAISGNYAYVTESNSGMSIINISNPAAPNRVGFYNIVDTTPPTVNWVEPVGNTQTATVYGQSVQLRADASDDRGVTSVVFRRWDYLALVWITLLEDTTAPYTYSLDTSTLNPSVNQVNATAYDAAGNSDDKYIWVSLQAPQAPTIGAIANADGDGSYTVGWSSSVGATSYKLEENLNGGAWSQVYSGSNLSVSRTGRSTGNWCYRVRAANKVGDGPWSGTVCTTVTPANQPPNAPTTPIPANNATNVATTAAVSWTGSDPENDTLTYEVRFGTANPPPTAVTSQSGATYDPPGSLANSTTYYWQIVAKDAAHPSGTAGPVWSFTTASPANQPPNTPANPNPANNTTNVATTATVSWTGSDPENDTLTYEVRFGTTNPPLTAVTSQSGTTYDPPGSLANSTTYYWQIVAKDAAHPSGTASPVWSFTTTGGTPTFPNVFYISPAANVTIAGIAAQGADILRYTKSTNTWTMVYDGSVRGTLKNISAFDMLDDGSLLLVFGANQVIAGLGTATPYDVVQFTPNAPGVFPLGTGTYSWFFQGKAKGLTTAAEKIDAIDKVFNRLLISITGTGSVPVTGGTMKPADEDAFTYNPATGTWLTPLRLDGSVVPGLAVEDVNGIWDDPSNDDYYITILGAFNLGGVKGNDKSIVRLMPNGSGGWTPSLVTWLAPGATFPGKIDGLDIVR